MSQVCDPIPLGCDVCNELILTQGTTINVVAGLSPATMLYLWVTDKFKNQYSNPITINGDGSFDIDTTLFTSGMFNPSAGSFYLFVTSDSDGEIKVPINSKNCIIFSVACCQGIGCMQISNDFIIN